MKRSGYVPWYVSAAAVRRYMVLRGLPPEKFDDASDDLIRECAAVWARYEADPARAPKINRTGAYIYRGGMPLRLEVVVSMAERREGAKPQVVDVLSAHGRGRNHRSPSRARRRARYDGESK